MPCRSSPAQPAPPPPGSATAGAADLCRRGASGRLAVQDGVELHPTFGWPHERLVYLMAGGEAALVRSLEGAEDDAAAGKAAVEALRPGRRTS